MGDFNEVYAMISKSRLLAWRNIGVLTLMFCLFYGLLNLCLLPTYFSSRMGLRLAATLTAVGFGLSGLIIICGILIWLRRTNRSLKELGWGKSTRPVAIVVAVVYAIAMVGMIYMNNRRLGVEFNLWEMSLVRLVGALATVFAGGFVEEIAMRGVIMTELSRIRVKTWLQILVSSLCFAIYHNLKFLIDLDPVTFAVGMVLCTFMGSIFAGIYVLGRRSLTPCIICHSLANLLVEPYHLMAYIAVVIQ